jgi:hypothetical protein
MQDKLRCCEAPSRYYLIIRYITQSAVNTEKMEQFPYGHGFVAVLLLFQTVTGLQVLNRQEKDFVRCVPHCCTS